MGKVKRKTKDSGGDRSNLLKRVSKTYWESGCNATFIQHSVPVDAELSQILKVPLPSFISGSTLDLTVMSDASLLGWEALCTHSVRHMDEIRHEIMYKCFGAKGSKTC